MSRTSARELTAMRAAYEIATFSPDRSTQNGAAIILGERETILEYNRFTDGVDARDDAFHEKPLKYQLIIHAERGALYWAAAVGVKTYGLTMVACWAACSGCAQAIVQSGIRRLVVHGDRMDATPDRWREEVDRGLWLLDKGGVEVVRLEGPVNAGVKIRFDGREIEV